MKHARIYQRANPRISPRIHLHTKLRANFGFTLVELMIAITIGLIVLGAATTIMVHSNKNYKVQNDLARIQENARFAMEFLARDIRMAGYFGCVDDVTSITNAMGDGSFALFNTTNRVEGSENAAAWAPSGAAAPATMVPGSDAITVRYADPSTALPVLPAYMTEPTGDIVVGTNTWAQNDYVVATDCNTADIFQITGPNPQAGTIVHAAATKIYEGEAQVMKLGSARYFVGTTPAGTTALFRVGFGPGGVVLPPDELVEGIDSMQILYGEDLDGDVIPDQYVNAAAVTTWDLVTGVRVGLSVASVDELGTRFEDDHDNYDLDRDGTDDITNPGDRRRRRIFTSTMLMRNLQ